EDRAAVWMDDNRLMYIGGDGMTYVRDFKTGGDTPVTRTAHGEYGFLMDRMFRVGVQGRPDFGVYDRVQKTIAPGKNLGGCQPYFTHDGVWGYWTAGSGGPIKRICLATAQVSVIVEKNDPRMPSSRRYLYFPMASRCGRLFAFAASPNQHDHFKSDYDIFVAPCDPVTLALTGRPVRLTSDKGCDRFPDVHLEDPVVRSVSDPADAMADLAFASLTNRSLPPKRQEQSAQVVYQSTWPCRPEGLVFLWQTGDQTNRIQDPATGDRRFCEIKARGRARLNHDQAMELSGGAYLAPDFDDLIVSACQAANQLSVEAFIRPADLKQGGPARIVSLSNDPANRNFTLGQEGNRLIMRLRTPRTGVNGASPEAPLFSLDSTQAVHVLVTYRDGRLTCYRDGVEVMTTDRVKGDLSNWSKGHLIFGDEYTADRDWSGRLEGIAIYARELDAAEARRNAALYRGIHEARPAVPTYSVIGRVVALSRIPTLIEIAPYRDALVCHEYEIVEPQPDGLSLGGRIRVGRWAILNGQAIASAQVRVGTTARLLLEPFARNRQVERLVMADTLDPDFDAPLFLEVSEP
ncbi:MAG: LamG domain-containing protein, partial [Kiritimatiellia bacterium]